MYVNDLPRVAALLNPRLVGLKSSALTLRYRAKLYGLVKEYSNEIR